MPAEADRDCPICDSPTEVDVTEGLAGNDDRRVRNCTDDACNWSVEISGPTTTPQ